MLDSIFCACVWGGGDSSAMALLDVFKPIKVSLKVGKHCILFLLWAKSAFKSYINFCVYGVENLLFVDF